MRILTLTVALFLLLLGHVIPLQAQEEPVNPAPTLLITPELDQLETQGLVISVTLTDASGQPLANELLSVYLDSTLYTRGETDANGAATIPLGGRIAPGNHEIRVEFPGTSEYPSVSARTVIDLSQEINQLVEREEEINPAALTINPFPSTPVGQPVVLEMRLVNAQSRPLGNMPLLVYVDGEAIRRARTDENGQASFGIGREYTVGTHEVRVEFLGTQAYDPVSSVRTLLINPIEFTVQTVPPLPNMQFLFNGSTILSTDENGLARAEVGAPGIYPLAALPLENNLVNESTKAEFQRWSDSVFTVEREIEITGDTTIQAGYTVDHPVNFAFIDLDSEPVEDTRVTTFTIRTSTGEHLVFEDGQTSWLQSTRINRRREGLEATQILYSVEEVVVDGSNVVNRYQQRFYVSPNDLWTIQLLLYYAQIQAFDAIFGFPVGTGINVTLPSGETVYYPYNTDNGLRIGPMGRGTYKLEVVGVQGMTQATPTALSRDQVVELKVVTYLDMGIGVLAGALVGFGLLFYGRPFLLTLPFRTVRRLLSRRSGELPPVVETPARVPGEQRS